MANIALTIILFLVGLVCIIKGGDWFVDAACGLAYLFRIPDVIIGATVVSIGTTLPEVMVSATGAATGHGSMAYGNAIGSIICNTAFILAITLIIRPGKADRKSLIFPSVFFFISAAIYAVISYTTGYFSRLLGIILLSIFVVYMILTIRQGILSDRVQFADEDLVVKKREKAETEIEDDPSVKWPIWKCIVFLIIGAALITIGARLLVNKGTLIAQMVGVPESVIALTFVALGTSLPELVTAITSLVKGHSSLSLGNIIGANLFNLVLVSGVSITINPFGIPVEKTIAGINASLLIDVPLMIIVMLILIVPALIKEKLYRIQGIILFVLYAGFVTFQFITA